MSFDPFTKVRASADREWRSGQNWRRSAMTADGNTRRRMHVHLVGYAASGKTTLAVAMKDANPSGTVIAERYFYREAGLARRVMTRMIAALRVPRILLFAIRTRPDNLRDLLAIVGLLFEHHKHRASIAGTRAKLILYDEGILHKFRQIRKRSSKVRHFSDLSARDQKFLAHGVDCVVHVAPPFEAWKTNKEKRGGGSNLSADKYNRSNNLIREDLKGLLAINPNIICITVEIIGDSDIEVKKIHDMIVRS